MPPGGRLLYWANLEQFTRVYAMTMIRFTRQRKAVLEAVRASREHPDAARVYTAVRHALPNISLATVYRSLETLVRDGHLVTIQRAGEATRYDARIDGHYHLVCDACGEVFDANLELPDLLPLAQGRVSGFEVRGALVEFHGVCERCAGAPSGEDRALS
jgi:Fe2+ or Zn2+ uptake regulation protein